MTTSNICSNQALNALRAGVFIDLLGSDGINELFNQCFTKANTLKDAISSIDNLRISFEGDF